MKKRFPLTTLFAAYAICVLLPFRAAALEVQPSEKGLFYPSRLQTKSGTYIHVTQFASARVCAGCHAEIFYQWEGSMHSRAHEDPLYMNFSKMASRETGGLTDTFCAGCHSPLAVAGGEVPPVGNPEMSRVGVEGLTCDFCHTIEKGIGIGNLAAVLDPGPVKRGPREGATSPFHKTEYLELSTQAEFCGVCHNVSHPLNNLPIENTYTEWHEGPYNSDDPQKRVYCQDCHMRQKPGAPATGMTQRSDLKGKSATMGPWRDHIYSHYFVGGNASITSLLGEENHRKMALERLKAAATLELIDIEKTAGSFTYAVRVTNSGAGHYLPTGLTEVRQMWIETTVISEKGDILFSSGTLDEQGVIPPGTVVFHTVIGDADGQPTKKVWEGATILSDRRIPPREHDEVTFTVKTDRRWRGKATIKARLLYRSYSPDVAVFVLGEGAIASIPVEMSAVEMSLDLK